MVSALSEVGGLWVCAALNDRERTAARRAPDGHLAEAGYDTGGLDVRMLPLDPSTFSRAYNGIANSTIWFVHHLLYDSANTPVFDAGWRRLWAAYERYNRSFADALAAEAAPGRRSWCRTTTSTSCRRSCGSCATTCGSRTSRTRPGRRRSSSRCCRTAVGRELLTGLLGADHLGFHCARWARRVPACCSALLGANVNGSARTVQWEGRRRRRRCTRSASRPGRCGSGPAQEDVEAGWPTCGSWSGTGR